MANKPLRPCRQPGCYILVSSGYCEDHQLKHQDRRSEEAQSWRWMYKTNEWISTRRPDQLVREPFGRAGARTSVRTRATDVDHIQPHRGDWALFTDPDNLQSLCKSCHDRKTAQEMQQQLRA